MSTERIDNLRAEAAAAIAAAGDTDELEELRVRYLGRKSELTSILRGISDLDPAERGPVGAGANAARQALEAELETRATELEAAEMESSLAAGAIDVTMPGAPPAPERRSEPARPHPARDRGRLRRPRLPGDGGP